MKAVAIVTNSLSGGGAERAMNLLAASLSRFPELNVTLIAINAGSKDLVEPDCQLVEIGRKWKGGIWDTTKSFIRFQFAILKFKPDFLVLNCDLPEFYSALAFWTGKSVIVEHTTNPWAGRAALGSIVRLILRVRGASWIRVSERIPQHPKFKLQATIPNIIEPNVLLTYPLNYRAESQGGKLVFVGRFSQEKRPELFVELARKTGIPSVMIGEGMLRHSLQEENRDVSNLEFLGQRRNPWESVSQNDLVVITSDYEGDGLVALEAAAIGIPVALRNTPDLRAIGFPARNYFEDSAELVLRINDLSLNPFTIDELQKNQILMGRSSGEVSLKWLSFINAHG